MFAKVIQRLRPRERGTFTINKADCDALRWRITPNFKQDLLHYVEVTQSTSTRTIASGMCVPHSTAQEVLHEQQLYNLTIPRGYMQWIQPSLHSALISGCGSYTVSITDSLHR